MFSSCDLLTLPFSFLASISYANGYMNDGDGIAGLYGDNGYTIIKYDDFVSSILISTVRMIKTRHQRA